MPTPDLPEWEEKVWRRSRGIMGPLFAVAFNMLALLIYFTPDQVLSEVLSTAALVTALFVSTLADIVGIIGRSRAQTRIKW